jgi:cytochrome c553
MTDFNTRCRRPRVLGFAAVLLYAAASAHAAPLAERIALCAGCHGEDGNSRLEKIPSLAGQPAFFVLNSLFLMREGVRRVDAMASIVKGLTDEDLDGLSKHYAALTP